MIEEDAIACKDFVSLPVVDGDPVTIQLGSTWREGEWQEVGKRRGGGEGGGKEREREGEGEGGGRRKERERGEGEGRRGGRGRRGEGGG